MPSLSQSETDHFLTHGYLKIEQAFSQETAEAATDILWRDLSRDHNIDRNPSTWTKPLVRLMFYSDEPFLAAANTEKLHAAYDSLAGPGRWQRPNVLGTFPIRFPSKDDPGDTGWHADMSFDWQNPDWQQWRINLYTRDRALLMLFLFSDTSEADGATRIRTGSHLPVARALKSADHAGLTMRELIPTFAATKGLPEVSATGKAGTVYLCHPFLVHAAQQNHGNHPRFLAQPPLMPTEPFQLDRPNNAYSLVEQAIRNALL